MRECGGSACLCICMRICPVNLADRIMIWRLRLPNHDVCVQEWAAALRRQALPAVAAVQASYAPSISMSALFMGGGEDDDGTCVNMHM